MCIQNNGGHFYVCYRNTHLGVYLWTYKIAMLSVWFLGDFDSVVHLALQQ